MTGLIPQKAYKKNSNNNDKIKLKTFSILCKSSS